MPKKSVQMADNLEVNEYFSQSRKVSLLENTEEK